MPQVSIFLLYQILSPLAHGRLPDVFYKLKRVEAGLGPTHIPKFFNLGLIVKLLTR